MKLKIKTTQKIKNIINNFIKQNYKEYLLVIIIFIIGILIGVIIVNNSQEENLNNISTYINEFINRFKEMNSINIKELTINSIKSNILFAIIIWFAGTTIIGMPGVLGMIGIRGIALGYTLASFTYYLGLCKGIAFNVTALLLQNIIFIPAMLTLGVSSIKLYKSILKDRRKENIKIEIIKHTTISLLMLIALIIASLIENTISFVILHKIIKYF